MKKAITVLIFFSILLLSLVFSEFLTVRHKENKLISYVFAQNENSTPENKNYPIIHIFHSNSCPHCKKEIEFLNKLKTIYPGLTVKDYEISKYRENALLFEKTAKLLNTRIDGVPFTVIGDTYISGYGSEETTGKLIESRILLMQGKDIPDVVETAIREKDLIAPEKIQTDTSINIPFLGVKDLKNYSLPAITFVIALLDGFNPCAMWTLIFLISLLIGLKDRRRMWLLGSAFIGVSGFVYFLFLSAWLNFFLFLGFVTWTRIAIGLLALGAGSYYLYDFFTNKDAACKVTKGNKRQQVFEKIKEIVLHKSLIISLFGISLLAIAVNSVELVCSAGLPAIYTKILSMANLPLWKYYLYLVFYVTIFMLDDLLIFAGAMFTLKMTGLSGKYSRYSHLLGGVLMIIIGLFLIFKPQALSFG